MSGDPAEAVLRARLVQTLVMIEKAARLGVESDPAGRLRMLAQILSMSGRMQAETRRALGEDLR